MTNLKLPTPVPMDVWGLVNNQNLTALNNGKLEVDDSRLTGIATTLLEQGGKDDAQYTTATTTPGSATVTLAAGLLTSTAVDAGKLISIADAAAAGTHFLGKILTVTSPTVAVLTAVVPLAVAGKEAVFGSNNTTAIAAAQAVLAAYGGGTLLYTRSGAGTGTGRYLNDRSIRTISHVHHRASDPAITIINRWSGGTVAHSAEKSAFLPGFHHPAGTWTNTNGTANLNPGSPKLAHLAINAVECGQVDIVGTTAGVVAAGIAVGDYVGVRSHEAHTQSAGGGVYDEMPHQHYLTKVEAKVGDTVTLKHPSPYAITSAYIYKIDGTQFGNGVAFTGNADFTAHGDAGREPLHMVEDVRIEGFTLDARDPVWGGGCFDLIFRHNKAPVGKPWRAFFTVNSIVDSVIEHNHSDWTFTWAELKFASGNVTMRDNRGKWVPSSEVTYTPVGVGESSYDIKIYRNDLTLPPAFSDSTKLFIDVKVAQDVDIHHNHLRALATALDAVFGSSSTSDAFNRVNRCRVRDNFIYLKGGAVTGLNRVFKVGIDQQTYGPKGVRITDNEMTGLLKQSSVNEWLNAQVAEDIFIEGNVPPEGTQHDIGPGVKGHVDVAPRANFTGFGSTVHSAMGWIAFGDTINKNFGSIPRGAVVRSVIIEVVTAFNAGANNTLTVSHGSLANQYAVALDVSAVAVKYVVPGATEAGALLGKRLTGLGVTSLRQLVGKFNGTGAAATTGLALVTVEYYPTSPDST